MVDQFLRGEQIGEAAEDRERRRTGEYTSHAPATEGHAGGERTDDPRHAEQDRHGHRLPFLVGQRLRRGVVPGLRLVDGRREGIRPPLWKGLAATGILGRSGVPAHGQGQGDKQAAYDDRGGVLVKSAAAGDCHIVRHRIVSGNTALEWSLRLLILGLEGDTLAGNRRGSMRYACRQHATRMDIFGTAEADFLTPPCTRFSHASAQCAHRGPDRLIPGTAAADRQQLHAVRLPRPERHRARRPLDGLGRRPEHRDLLFSARNEPQRGHRPEYAFLDEQVWLRDLLLL